MNKRSHIIIYNENYGYLLMLKYKFDKGIYHQLLSGGLEMNESYEEAIIREIKEEINIDVKEDDIIKLHSIPFRNFYYMKMSNKDINNIRISSEHIGYTFIKKQDLLPQLIKKQAKNEISQVVQFLIDKNLLV